MIIAVVLQALWGLLRTAVKTPFLGVLAVVAAGLYLAGVHELAILFGAAAIALASGLRSRNVLHAVELQLFLIFLKIGTVLYGSGYVLLAFPARDFVDRLGWITDTQLLDRSRSANSHRTVVHDRQFSVRGGLVPGASWDDRIFCRRFLCAVTTPFVARMRQRHRCRACSTA